MRATVLTPRAVRPRPRRACATRSCCCSRPSAAGSSTSRRSSAPATPTTSAARSWGRTGRSSCCHPRPSPCARRFAESLAAPAAASSSASATAYVNELQAWVAAIRRGEEPSGPCACDGYAAAAVCEAAVASLEPVARSTSVLNGAKEVLKPAEVMPTDVLGRNSHRQVPPRQGHPRSKRVRKVQELPPRSRPDCRRVSELPRSVGGHSMRRTAQRLAVTSLLALAAAVGAPAAAAAAAAPAPTRTRPRSARAPRPRTPRFACSTSERRSRGLASCAPTPSFAAPPTATPATWSPSTTSTTTRKSGASFVTRIKRTGWTQARAAPGPSARTSATARARCHAALDGQGLDEQRRPPRRTSSPASSR